MLGKLPKIIKLVKCGAGIPTQQPGSRAGAQNVLLKGGKIRLLVVYSFVESFVTITALWLLLLSSCSDMKEVDDTC